MPRITPADVGLLLIRLMLGVVFIYHGAPKLFGGLDGFAGYLGGLGVPLPTVAALLAALAEFLGGLLLIAGLYFRLALWPTVITMLVAAFMVHGHAFNVQDQGMEYPLTLAVMVAGLALTGPGALTVGKLLGRGAADPGDGADANPEVR
jgi:putative oxidoreductase